MNLDVLAREFPQHTLRNNLALKIRTADTEDQRSRARMLINERYALRGYGTDFTLDQHPDQISFVASNQNSGSTIGTLTVVLDGERGLLAERVYPAEIQSLRTNGFRLCEITKFAVGNAISCKHLFGKLFHMAFIHAYHLHKRSDLLIEVTPKHARFYQRLLHFEVFGAEKFNPRVSTRGVLLRLDLNYAAEQILRHGGKGESSSEQSLYAYALSPIEQRRIFGDFVDDETAYRAAA